MDLPVLRKSGLIIGEILAGSHLYGLNIETSDKDYRGIFRVPLKEALSLHTQDQVNDATNDVVFYELKKFISLASKANPNILELLYASPEFIIQDSSAFQLLRENRQIFLSEAARQSFVGYAIAQIKKARGLNKKIFNPQPKIRKSILDFCYILQIGESVKLTEIYAKEELVLMGLSSAQNGKGLYALWDTFEGARGIVNKKETSSTLRLSSIPKDAHFLDHIWFNEDEYKVHCKEWAEYWKWVEVRNEARYSESTEANYDRKNMMHVFRLLNMGIELVRDGQVNVYRPDRDFLLGIRRGDYKYEHLVKEAEVLISKLDGYKSSLPKQADMKAINNLLYEIRIL